MKNIREAAVAGIFYPASESQLKSDIQFLLNSNKPEQEFNNIVGIISPHAGYIYSGNTAAYAYNVIKGKKYSTVIIISPSHREYFPGICIYEGNAYSTPLGIVEINEKVRNELTIENSFIFKGVKGHKDEHAIEVQIPFLQMVLEDFTIVPIIIGDQRKEYVFRLAEKLSTVINDQTLIVASSDLSHFYNKAEADKLDSQIQRRIESFDYEGLQFDFESKKCEACGGGGIIALMKAADLNGKNKAMVLSHTDSGDVTNDDSEVVGYLSAVVYGTGIRY
jgi:hypothetical protein